MPYRIESTCVPVEFLVMGPIENNVYIIGDRTSTFVVDPTCDAPRIVEALDGRTLDAIVLTHAHWDHVAAAADLRQLTGAKTVASVLDAPVIDGSHELDPSHRPFTPCPIDRVVKDGDELAIGAMKWRVMETPGHTPGSMCLLLESQYGSNPEGAPVLVAGDTLFRGAHGRTDFVGGDPAAMRQSLANLAKLPPEVVVLPGHNTPTTIAAELPWMTR